MIRSKNYRLIILLLSLFPIFSYGQSNLCSSAPDLGTLGFELNRAFNINNTNTTTPAEPNVSCGVGVEDGWMRFTASNSTNIVIQFSNQEAASPGVDDAILQVFRLDGTCTIPDDLLLLNCVDNVFSAGTERTNISATAGETYYVRVITKLDYTGGNAMRGRLTIYEGTSPGGDLCSSAIDVSVGTCNFTFDVQTDFYNHENLGGCTSFDPTANNNRDGWLKFTTGSTNTRIAVNYEVETGQDYELQVYSGACGNLSPIGSCVSNTYKEFNANASTTYFVRVMNVTDANTMEGRICIEEAFYRNNCGDVLGGTYPVSTPLSVGECNVSVRVRNNSGADGSGFANCFADNDDTWLVFTPENTTDPVRIEFSAPNANIDPDQFDLSLYYNTGSCPIDDGTRLACDGNIGGQINAITFTPSSVGNHYIRIKNRTGGDIEGTLCIYEGSKKAEDNFFSANSFVIDGDDCGKVFNILGNFSNSGQGLTGTPNSGGYPYPLADGVVDSEDLSCSSGASQKDAWARFEISGGLSEDLIIEYNNDNFEPSIANDVTLLLYKSATINTGVPLTMTTSAGDEDDNALAVMLDTPYDFNIDDFGDGVDATPGFESCGTGFSPTRDGWVTFTSPASGGIITVVYEDGTPQNSAINVYDLANTLIACSATQATQETSYSVTFNSSPSTTYKVRIASGAATTNGKLTIYTEFTLVGCSDNAADPVSGIGGEGVERIILDDATPGLDGNYFIRVANNNVASTTTGQLCIRPDVTVEGDICATRSELLVGDCDIEFSLINPTSPDGFDETPLISADPTPASSFCGIDRDPMAASDPKVSSDGWFSFVATATQTTVQYYTAQENNGSVDIALAAYRGSCGSLIFVECVDNTSAGEFIEEFDLNTIVGLEYYIRVMDINSNPNTDIDGRLCIFNTTQRDVCDDDDIVTRAVGDCNIPFNVPVSFDNTGSELANYIPGQGTGADPNDFPITIGMGTQQQSITSSCESSEPPFNATDNNPNNNLTTGTPRDGWMRFIGTGEEVTLTYETDSPSVNPSIVVYTALLGVGPVNCSVGINGAGNTGNQFACVNDITSSGPQTENMTFLAKAGQIYIIRIINLDGTTDMEGILCISDADGDYNDACEAREVQVGDCSIPLNITQDINDCFVPSSGTIPDIGPCDDCSTADAWAVVQVPYACDIELYDTAETVAGNGNTPVNLGTNYGIDYDASTPGVQNTGSDPICVESPSNDTVQEHLAYNDNGTTGDNSDDYCTCRTGSVPVSDFYKDVTIQYNTDDGLLVGSGTDPDVNMVVYEVTSPALPSNCDDGSQYTNPACTDTDPATAVGGEGLREITIVGALDSDGNSTIENGEGGRYYLIRVINQNATSAFGDLCLFYGDDIGTTDCTPGSEASMDDYGDLEGEFKSITIPGWSSTEENNSQLPTETIANCVLPGGSTPRSRSDRPVRTDTWIKFEVPESADPTDPVGTPEHSAVTVQYSNVAPDGGSLNSRDRNVAIAIYGPNVCPSSGTPPLDCANTVFVGTESLTFAVPIAGEYFVRVMNVHRTRKPDEYIGRIRVFPFAECQEGPELVVDGDFSGWPGIIRGINSASGFSLSSPIPLRAGNNFLPIHLNGETVPDNFDASPVPAVPELIGITTPEQRFDLYRADDVFTQPYVTATDAYPNDLDQNVWSIGGTLINTGISRFATQYGYIPDRGRDQQFLPDGSSIRHSDPTTENEWRRIRAFYGDLKHTGDDINEIYSGVYKVHQSSRELRDYWPSYAMGYSGWSGGPDRGRTNYCLTGAPGDGTQGCDEIDLYGDSSFITEGAVNDSETNDGIERQAPIAATSDANFMVVDGSYDGATDLYPSKIWCQTIERANDNVGYYVFTVWVNNLFPDGLNGGVPLVRVSVCDMEDPNNLGDFPNRTGTVPDKTNLTLDANGLVEGTLLPGVTYAAETPVAHLPIPPVDRSTNAAAEILYGAAVGCNLPVESFNARLKPLGSSFLIEEGPDDWVVVRCIYRAPEGSREFNVCVENLSLTRWGNNIGLDRFSLRECESANAVAFDRLLKGDPCELADRPDALGIPLTATMLDFTGHLIGDKVFLNWVTIQEHNSAYFEVQRSFNGQDFTKIGQVEARGNGSTYNFVDREIPEGLEVVYYRLNIVDNNGLGNLGPLIDVSLNALETFDLRLIPNPVVQGKSIIVEFNVEESIVGLEIADMVGNKLLQREITATEGVNEVELNTSSLKPGIYIVRIIHKGKAVSKKLLII